jgi:hypothetical protein
MNPETALRGRAIPGERPVLRGSYGLRDVLRGLPYGNALAAAAVIYKYSPGQYGDYAHGND